MVPSPVGNGKVGSTVSPSGQNSHIIGPSAVCCCSIRLISFFDGRGGEISSV